MNDYFFSSSHVQVLFWIKTNVKNIFRQLLERGANQLLRSVTEANKCFSPLLWDSHKYFFGR